MSVPYKQHRLTIATYGLILITILTPIFAIISYWLGMSDLTKVFSSAFLLLIGIFVGAFKEGFK